MIIIDYIRRRTRVRVEEREGNPANALIGNLFGLGERKKEIDEAAANAPESRERVRERERDELIY